jgi:hypothetical protein
MVAYNCIKKYFEACKAAETEGSIIFITEDCADGPKCGDFLQKNFYSETELPIFGYEKGIYPFLSLYKMSKPKK